MNDSRVESRLTERFTVNFVSLRSPKFPRTETQGGDWGRKEKNPEERRVVPGRLSIRREEMRRKKVTLWLKCAEELMKGLRS
jgi:hypothetical protein